MNKTIFFILPVLFITSLKSKSQIKEIGLPCIKNYAKERYHAGPENYAIAQDQRGIMYIGNSEGLLEFDGNTWQLYRMPNQSPVHSLCIGPRDTIFIGAINDLGYMEQTGTGLLRFKSLSYLIPETFRNFGEITGIFNTGTGIVFLSHSYLFIYNHSRMKIRKSFSNFEQGFCNNDRLFVSDDSKGILSYQNGTLIPFITRDALAKKRMQFVLPFSENQWMIGTVKNGVYLYNGKNLSPWNTPVNKELKNATLTSVYLSPNQYLVFATREKGVFITNLKGVIIDHLTRFCGLQDNDVLNISSDHQHNLWLALENGISYVEINSPISYINYFYGIESGITSIVHNDILYLGTSQGLFAKRIDSLSNIRGFDRKFTLVKNSRGKVACLSVIGNMLLCGEEDGIYTVNGYNAEKVAETSNVLSFLLPEAQQDKLLAGTTKGLIVLQKKGAANWTNVKPVAGFALEIKRLLEEKNHNIWVSTAYNGIYRIRMNQNMDSVKYLHHYTSKDGLPDGLRYHLNQLENQIFITTRKGIYEYNPQTHLFSVSQIYTSFFHNNPGITRIITDAKGNRWYFSDSRMGVYRLMEDGSYKEIFIPFLSIANILPDSKKSLYIYDSKNIFIGTENGFVHYDPTLTKDYSTLFHTYIRRVWMKSVSHDSLISFEPGRLKPGKNEYTIPYTYNTLLFRIAAPGCEDPERTDYRYELKGYDKTYSDWTRVCYKEYTNLPAGKYTLMVQSRNQYLSLSKTDEFSFRIRPPFYRTRIAYMIYLIIVIVAIGGNLTYFSRRIKHTKRRERLLLKKRMMVREQQFREESLLAEKEIEHLRNETLMNEMEHKNKELANSTMHLIQKNKFLTQVKNELTGILNSNLEETHKSTLNQLIKRIDKDINNEKFWKVFDAYFDEVHQDFLMRMKEKHPELSPKELRLSAYLRMNISTKEIATLMNISVRGVEVSRYRLRKKLNIERDTNLTEYILKF